MPNPVTGSLPKPRGRRGSPQGPGEAIPLRQGAHRRSQHVIVESSSRFRPAYRKLTPAERDRVNEAIERMVAELTQPSLRVQRMQGTAELWEARASAALRTTFIRISDGISLSNVGAHDPTLKRP